ncbi:hypothetical protein BASA81_005888 [Batrachochytrium salamandrivorans]|nr:hypothetical protein BASA81_005888 [Batrachochytrium salamandrivorans]
MQPTTSKDKPLLLVPCTPLAFSTLYCLPPPSASRFKREISLQEHFPGPYQAKAKSVTLHQEVEISNHETRGKERIQTERRRPLSSTKVRGGESFAVPTMPQQQMITQDELAMSLVVIGNKSCLVPDGDRFVDPDLLFCKPPGLATGLSLVETQQADEQMKRELERKKRLQKLTLQQQEDEEEEDEKETETAVLAVAPYPEAKEQKTRQDEYTAIYVKPWSILDESDVSDFHLKVPKMAIEYGFELDLFQKRAVLHLEQGESVFAAAHTSAGKTVIAEYAIALAFEHRTRLIYTSPIKALSNQKFRDFSEKFGASKVGLLTGDNSVNSDAPCVVMTTEILRSMLYRGAEMIRDVEFVVFDEIHYVNDADRGVIWEEVIIMLPMHVHVIMLSATTPNTMEFSAWVGRNRREQVFVVSTFKRPVPLEHYLYCSPGQRFLLMDSHGQFYPEAHRSASLALRAKDPFAEVVNRPGNAGHTARRDAHFVAQRFQHSGSSGGSRNVKTGESRWLDLIKDLNKQDLLPVIVFTFSKRQVESRAASLLKLDLLNSSVEKSRVHVIMTKALSRLQVGDRDLPQIKRVADLLQRGIGIHHGGLLPILKEVVEICFTNGLVRALIATETFAMGVNAPCRTVCFGGLKKHDGLEFRELLPGEYIQMAGRSGRRGIDTVGSVMIHCEDDVPPLEVLVRMLTGKSSQLESRFRLRYSMILNLLRTDELSVADMMKRSFSEFSTLSIRSQKAVEIKALKKDLVRAKRVFTQLGGNKANEVSQYHAALHEIAKTVTWVCADLLTGRRGARAQEWILKPGRVIECTLAELNLFSVRSIVIAVVATTGGGDGNVLVCAARLPQGYQILPLWQEENLLAKQAAPVVAVEAASKQLPVKMKRKYDDDDDDEFTVKKGGKKANQQQVATTVINLTYDVPPRALFGEGVVLFTLPLKPSGGGKSGSGGELELVSNVLIPVGEFPKSLQDRLLSKQRLEQDVITAVGLIPDSSLDPVSLSDLKVSDFQVLETWNTANGKREALLATVSTQNTSQLRQLAKDVHQIDIELFTLLKETSDESLALFPDFQSRLQVLHSEHMLNQDGVELKGRVACEINTCDELLLTELIFDNLFDELDPAECCALLSCLVLQGKCEDQVDAPTSGLEFAWERTQAIASRLAELQQSCGVNLGVDDWVGQVLNPGMLLVAYEWAKGVPFSSLVSLTSLEEGTIVRCITRLDETCREVKNVSRLIGNPQLLIKMEAASLLIKRDIVFATSLYVG